MSTIASETMATLKDVADIWPLIIGGVALIGWVDRRRKRWMEANIAVPIAQVHRRVDSVKDDVAAVKQDVADFKSDAAASLGGLSERVHTLEIVHATEGVTPAEISDMLASKRRGDERPAP